MSFCGSIARDFNCYLRDIPLDIGKKAVMSGTIAFVVGTVFSGNPVIGAMSGGLSATATLIHGLITPVFKDLANGYNRLDWAGEMLRGNVAYIAVGCIALAFGNAIVLNMIGVNALLYGVRTAIDSEMWRLDRTNCVFAFV